MEVRKRSILFSFTEKRQMQSRSQGVKGERAWDRGCILCVY